MKTKGVGVQSVVQGISIGSVFLPRRDYGGSEGVFRITPLRPVAELLKEARSLYASPGSGRLPQERSGGRSLAGQVDRPRRSLSTTRDFLATPVYGKARVMLQRAPRKRGLRPSRAQSEGLWPDAS